VVSWWAHVHLFESPSITWFRRYFDSIVWVFYDVKIIVNVKLTDKIWGALLQRPQSWGAVTLLPMFGRRWMGQDRGKNSSVEKSCWNTIAYHTHRGGGVSRISEGGKMYAQWASKSKTRTRCQNYVIFWRKLWVYLSKNEKEHRHRKFELTRCSAIAERPRCSVRYSFPQK